MMVANGEKQIIFNAIMATCNPGDNVVLPTPCWISYADQARLAGASVVQVPCHEYNGFCLKAEDLDAAITPQTNWVLLHFSNNPTGACFLK